MVKFGKKRDRRSIVLILPIIISGIFLSLLIAGRCQSYVYYERIEFDYAGTKFHANLYHPANDIEFQPGKHPLVIFVHGGFSQKDLHSRIPIELTKRGYYVASVDMPGHGENANSHLLSVDGDGDFVATELCSKLLNEIENLDCYNQIDEDQIGLLGHSYGGYVVLMNGLYDDRFKVTITWAGVADVRVNYKNADISEKQEDLIHENNPVEIMNNGTKQPENMLLIVHKEDFQYKYNKRLQNITKCEWEKYDYPVSGVREAHSLRKEVVMIKTISWFEKKFFVSVSKNGPIQLSYQYNVILIFTTLISLCFTLFSLMIYISNMFLKKGGFHDTTPKKRKSISSQIENPLTSMKKKNLAVITLSIFIFIGVWILCSILMGALGMFIGSVFNILIYVLFIRRILPTEEPKSEIELSFKDRIKSETTIRTLGYTLSCAGIFLGIYFAFALLYPFALYYPLYFFAFAITVIYIPIYLSTEILYRKIIYPSLNFIESKKKRTYIITYITFTIQSFLMLLTLGGWAIPIVIITSIAFIIVSVMNGIIYHKTEKFGAVMLNSFIILSIFYGAAWSLIFNLIAIVI